MKIEIAIQSHESLKDQGDLLENLCEKLLTAQHYEVVKNLRNTGAEIDLLCRHKVNRNKTIYIECKAYRNKKIDAATIYKLMGIRNQKNYSEAWLVSTSEYSKDAKGVVEEEYAKKNIIYYFYTPKKLVDALIHSGVIETPEIAKKEVIKVIGSDNNIDKPLLLVTKFGVFWVFSYLLGDGLKAVICLYADNSKVVKDKSLLENLSQTNTSFHSFDFQKIFSLNP